MELVATGSTGEALAGALAIALATLGLTRSNPILMASLATVVVGGALVLEGVAVGARIDRLAPLRSRERAELTSGMGAEFLAGVAGLTLGVLALLAISPPTLLAIASIAVGGGLLMGSAAISRIDAITSSGAVERAQPMLQRLARHAVRAPADAQAVVGLAAVVLGVLALVGFRPLQLSLIALLAIGGSLLLSGGAVSGRILNLLAR